MTTLMTSAAPAPARTARRRPWLSGAWRRSVVLVHVVSSVGWFGVTATFVVLTIGLLAVRDAGTLRSGYAVHELLVTWLARPAALLALGTGLLLSFGTQWGLTRYWWVPAKLVLLVATVAVTVSLSPDTLAFAIAYAEAAGTPAYTEAQHVLVALAFFHVATIGAATGLSVFKPGRRRAS